RGRRSPRPRSVRGEDVAISWRALPWPSESVMTTDDVRRLALALPEAEERDHHGRPSFRVRDKIYATLPDADHVNVMLAPDDILLASQHPSGACAPVHWGARLAAVGIGLARADAALVSALLEDAWARKAPK